MTASKRRKAVTVAALAMLACSGCSSGPPAPSEQCREVWKLRDQVKDIEPTSIDDIIKKREIIIRSEWCVKNPNGAWI